MRPEDDPRQTNFSDAIDDMRKRREEVIRRGTSESRPTAAATGLVSPDDRRRALSRWKSGWLAWHESEMAGDGYDALLTSLVAAPAWTRSLSDTTHSTAPTDPRPTSTRLTTTPACASSDGMQGSADPSR